MAYTFNGIDIYNTYGITAGHAPGSNIAMTGQWDMPQRIGTTFKDWGDSDSVEPWVREGEIMFAGRDIIFSGFLTGTTSAINTKLQTFYDAINAATGLSVFETPYHSASGYVKSVIPEHLNGGCMVKMTFRESVVALTGNLPASGTSVAYMIDNIPFSSFGLYLSKADQLHNLPENKGQYFTKYGQEGYQIVKRKHKILEMKGFVVAEGDTVTSPLSDFMNKIQALYKVFSSPGTRTIVLNTIATVECFATEGFKIENIHYSNNEVIGRFHINLMVKSVTYYADSGYDADLVTYMTGLSTPLSAGQKTLLNTFILTLKSGLSITNLSDAFDVMYILAGETAESSLRNLVKRLHDATAVNSPAWEQYKGVTGTLNTKYLNTNYNPDDASTFTQNNCSLLFYFNIACTGSVNQSHFRLPIEGVGHTQFQFRPQQPMVTGALNTAAVASYNLFLSITTGYYSLRRYQSTNIMKGLNKTYTSLANGSAVPYSGVFMDCNSNAREAFMMIGKYFSNDQLNLIQDAVTTYLTAVGGVA